MRLNQSVQKGIAILRAAGSDAGGETASGLARRADLPWATAVRFIRTLEAEGFLHRLPGTDRYVLGFELVRLGRAGDQGSLLAAVARPTLERLAQEVEETVNLTVVQPDGRLEIVEQIDPPRLIRPSNIGSPYPLHASSIGKLLLATYEAARLDEALGEPLPRYTEATITDPNEVRAELARVRTDGYAINVDEYEEGLTALSAGVRGRDGVLVAVVTVSGPSFRFDARAREEALKPVRKAADAIERLMAGADAATATRRAAGTTS